MGPLIKVATKFWGQGPSFSSPEGGNKTFSGPFFLYTKKDATVKIAAMFAKEEFVQRVFLALRMRMKSRPSSLVSSYVRIEREKNGEHFSRLLSSWKK